MLSHLKMSHKMLGGFMLVVFMLGAVILFQISVMRELARLQDVGAKRAQDLLDLVQMMETLDMSYGAMTHAMINRDIDKTSPAMAEYETKIAEDTKRIMSVVDTDEERALAKEYIDNITTYMATFKGQVWPILFARTHDSELDAATAATIRELNAKIDKAREAADTPLGKLIISLEKEMAAADQHFDSIPAKKINIATILGAISALAAMAIGYFLTRSIIQPINDSVQSLNDGSKQIAAVAGQIAAASQTLADGASEQASSLEETSASLEELTSMTKQNSDNASQADTLMRQSLSTIASTNQAMIEMDHSMSQIAASSEQTSKIIKTIDEIAFQTNLLALNAAVEAARAGEAGAGFAVVADEVRNLAMRATEAAKNTASLIEDTVQKVKSGKEIVTKVTSAFQEVTESSTKVGSLVGEISAASKEQAQGIGQINQAVTQMDSVTQQNAASSEQSAAAAEELNGQAENLIATVMKLHTLVEGQQRTGSPQRRPLQPASPPRRPALKRPPAATAKPAAKRLALAAPAKAITAPARPKPTPRPNPPKPKANDPEAIIPMGDDDNFEDF